MQLGSGNGTSFPTSVDTATTEVNSPASGKTKARAEVINDLLSAVIAIETSLNDGTGYVVYPSTQRVVTGSRTVASIYQNTTGRPLFVTASLSSTAAAGFRVYTDATATPSTNVLVANTTASGILISVSFVVLAGNYYTITVNAGTPTVSIWTEWY